MKKNRIDDGTDDTPVGKADASKNILNFGNLAIAAILIGLIAFLFTVRVILGIFIAATVVSVVLTPAVQLLEKRGLPKVTSILLLYFALLAIFVTVITLLVPVIVHQASQIIESYPEYRVKVLDMYKDVHLKLAEYGVDTEGEMFNYRTPKNQEALTNAAQSAITQGWQIIMGTASVITTMISIPVIAFYLLKDGPAVRKTLLGLIPESWHASTTDLLGELSKSVYNYLRGQLMLCCVIFIYTLLVLLILGVPYALLLAVVAGLVEFIPIVGPTLALIPAVLIAVFAQFEPGGFGVINDLEPVWRGLTVMLAYFGIQLTENNILVPRIMGSTMDIHPLGVIFALLCGAVIAGIWGMLLSLPVAAAVKVFYYYFYPSFIKRIDKLLSFE